jgi:hypothetical protein
MRGKKSAIAPSCERGKKTFFRTKTVFKIKEEQDGPTRYKSRVISLGYDMIPGKDYTDSYSSVATDSSTRIAFGISLYIMNRKHRERTLRKKIGEMAWNRKTDHAKLFCQIPECDDWTFEMYDVEAAFLNAEPGHKQYIKVPME